jgi:4'-phosphopantetheinyl transferase
MTQPGEKAGDRCWVSTSSPPVLTEDELHVWRVNLHESQPQIDGSLKLLSPDELQRAEGFIRGRDRDRFIVSHGALRRILSRYIPVPAETHVFHRGPWQKPYVITGTELVPSFNLSHSGDFAVLAVGLGRDVGVDIEQIRPITEESSIVDRVFSETDRRLYHTASTSARTELFFRLWTRQEARLKATGQGLSSDAPARSADEDQECNWTIEHFVPAAGYAGSIATTGPVTRVWYLDFA